MNTNPHAIFSVLMTFGLVIRYRGHFCHLPPSKMRWSNTPCKTGLNQALCRRLHIELAIKEELRSVPYKP